MNADAAISFVERHGVVLVSAKGPVPRLTEAIAGEPIKGSWWAHPKSHQIFAVLQKIGDSPDILLCRLVDGHVTLVHRRLWPAMVKLSALFHPEQLAQVLQEHTPTGQHVNQVIEYPKWVPDEVLEAARHLTAPEAEAILTESMRGSINRPAMSRRRQR
jgi:hypothetical protein